MAQSDLFSIMLPNELYTSKELSQKLKMRQNQVAKNLTDAMKLMSIYRLHKGRMTFYVYIQKKENKFKKRGKRICNNTTMMHLN